MSDTSSNAKSISFEDFEDSQTKGISFEEFEDPRTQLLNDEKQNAFDIHCSCETLILRANLGKWVERPKDKLRLPEGQALKKSYPETPSSSDDEAPNQGFWVLNDIMVFENIGVLRAVDTGVKYLCCAECDIGPLGYNDTKSKADEYLIAVDRVKYSRD